MTSAVMIGAPLARAGAAPMSAVLPRAVTLDGLRITQTSRLADVEADWRALERSGLESPGQSYDFVRLWIETLGIPAADQLFLTAQLDGRPLALLPLHRSCHAGVRLLGWFPGEHVGCGLPLIDVARFATLTGAERAQLWARMLGAVTGSDLVHLRNVPHQAYGLDAPFAELGAALPTETLYRAHFGSWEEANTTQRNKSRRKHDRQQGERLEALGAVSFEVMDGGCAAAGPVLAELLRQRARRFAVMGVRDPFAAPGIAGFYGATVAQGSPVTVKLHLLRLDGVLVATRYSIVLGDKLFCLISSMSDDPRIQAGSPGKQCLLRVMQSVFDAGFRVFDMGNGFTDEKRHWCNERIPLASHYVALTPVGRLALRADTLWRTVRTRIKGNARLLSMAKTLRARLRRGTPAVAAQPEAD